MQRKESSGLIADSSLLLLLLCSPCFCVFKEELGLLGGHPPPPPRLIWTQNKLFDAAALWKIDFDPPTFAEVCSYLKPTRTSCLCLLLACAHRLGSMSLFNKRRWNNESNPQELKLGFNCKTHRVLYQTLLGLRSYNGSFSSRDTVH